MVLLNIEIREDWYFNASAPLGIVLLVQNKPGYLNLSELIARAYTQNVVRAQAVVKMAWLKELNEGLIALSGAQAGPVGQALVQIRPVRGLEVPRGLGQTAHTAYMELQCQKMDDEALHRKGRCEMAACELYFHKKGESSIRVLLSLTTA